MSNAEDTDCMLQVELDPPMEHSGGTYRKLTVVWSEVQHCNFLLAVGTVTDSNDPDFGRPEEMAISVNLLPSRPTAHGYFYCRDDDYNAPLVRELVERKILVPTGQAAPSGFIRIPLFRFTPIEKAAEGNQ